MSRFFGFLMWLVFSTLIFQTINTYAGQASLSWSAPATNTDGTPLTDLAGYKVNYGTASGQYTLHTDVGNMTNYTVDLAAGTYYFSVTAYDSSGVISPFSNEVSKTIPASSSSSPYSISGATTSSDASGMSGVLVILSGAATGMTTTDSNGNYSFTGLSNGSYTVMPVKAGYSFTPLNVTLNGVNSTGNDITGVAAAFTVTPTAGPGGSIIPNTSQTVNYFGTASFTVTPNAGYIALATGCDGILIDNTYTTNVITSACTVSVTFVQTSPPPPPPLPVSYDNSMGMTNTGTLWAWGYNAYGELGNGATTDSYTPVQVNNLSGVTAVAGGYEHSLALQSGGTVWAWGYNGYGELGNGTTTGSYTPVQVNNLSGVTAVAGGLYHSLALESGGTVWAWGYNGDGELGNGSTVTYSPAPVQVSGLSGVNAVASGFYYSLALESGGTVWAWGNNLNGELGNSTTTNSFTPVQVNNLSGVTAVAAGGYHSLALKSDGTVWAWGDNLYGQLGDGTTTDRYAPVQVSGLSGVMALGAGLYHSLALESNGSVWAWGYNGDGELGDGSTLTYSTAPVQVSGLSGVTAVAGSYEHSLALESNGSVWAWGYNGNGELGDGTTTDGFTPVKVNSLGSAIAVAAGVYHSLAVQSANVFSDIPAGYWAEQYIDAIYNDGITTGCSNPSNQFQLIYLDCSPDGSDDVWREQMAAFIIRVLYGSNYTPICNGGVNCNMTTPYFSDVLPSNPDGTVNIFFPYIQKLYELGITNSNSVFLPSQAVPRDEMAAFIVRATQVRAGQDPESYTCDGGVNCSTTTPYFSDVLPSNPDGTVNVFFPYIQKLYELGITTGCPNPSNPSQLVYLSCPSDTVYRDDMAAFLARAFLGLH